MFTNKYYKNLLAVCLLVLIQLVVINTVFAQKSTPIAPKYVFLFIGAWATTKIPLIMFETATLGFRFMMLRLTCNIIGIIVIAKILEWDARRNATVFTL